MIAKLLFCLCFIGVTVCSQTQTVLINQSNDTNGTVSKVNIKVYYETLCPASVRFFLTQLKPVMEVLADYVNVDLIPYGHARTTNIRGHYTFRCQHGPAECYENMLHACAIDAIQNSTQAVRFNVCLMQYFPYRNNEGFNYLSVLNWCGYRLNLLINGVWECVNSSRGSILLKKYGEETHAVSPRYVPHVVLNGSSEKDSESRQNLMSTVCQMLHPSPEPCYS